MNFVGVGKVLPVVVQLGNGATDKFVRAKIYDDANTLLNTLSLTHVSNGLYKNVSVVMPDVNSVSVQGEAYNDSGFTSPTEDYIGAQLFTSKDETGGGLNLLDPILLAAQLGDGSTNLFPLATVYDDVFSVLSGTPVALASVANGLYQNNSILMPDSEFVVYQVKFFTDSNHTTPADQLLISQVVMSALVESDDLPICPDDLEISVAGFKAYFYRDFPYGNTASTVMNQDIRKALIEATCFVNKDLFCTTGSYNQGVLLLAAHFLAMNLRASSQGISGSFPWMQTSKSVGSVSESYQIPQWIMDNPEWAMLTKTNYGAQFLFMVLPSLSGQVFTVLGRTLP